MKYAAYRLGPISISLQGQGPVYDALNGEVSVLPSLETEAADVAFHFVDELEAPAKGRHIGDWILADGLAMGKGHGYDFRLRHREGRFDVDIAIHGGQKAPYDPAVRAVDWNYLAPWETTAKNIMYDLFDLVTATALLDKGAACLHASTCCRDERGVALIAWGGIGKTTSILKLITEDGWRYLSDDLGLLDEGGELYRTPKRLQVYAYNVEGQSKLTDRLLQGRGPIDRLNWTLRRAGLGPKKVRRRISAEELFGEEAVGDSAPMDRAIFLERAAIGDFEFDELERDVMSHRAATILLDELDTLVDLSISAESHGIDCGIPGVCKLREGFASIIAAGLEGVETHRLRIPVEAGPDMLADALRRYL